MTSPPADFEALLVRGATATLVLAGGWLALVVLAGAVETLSSGRVRGLAGVGCPPSWRPAVLLLVGAVLASPAGAAHAAVARPDSGSAERWLPLPTRPVDQPAPVLDLHVVVQPHDTLWGIARQQLAGTADDATVARQVARLHRANQHVVGDEPDLIHPGQRLALPPVPPEGAGR